MRESRTAGSSRPGWLVDAHAHLHPGFDLARSLGAAAANFRRATLALGAAASSRACMFLVEAEGTAPFRRLSSDSLPGGWRQARTAEPASLLLVHDDHPPMVVVRGRQLRTAEGLEVLAVGVPDQGGNELRDRRPIADTVRRAAGAAAVVILPWGFGKWRGRRARLMRATLRGSLPPRVFVGDTGNRPRLLPYPVLLREARAGGMWVLPGSDPLPLGSHAGRLGTCGAFLECEPDLENPLHQIVGLLSIRTTQPDMFCRPEPAPRFAVAQFLMQLPPGLRNRFAGGAA